MERKFKHVTRDGGVVYCQEREIAPGFIYWRQIVFCPKVDKGLSRQQKAKAIREMRREFAETARRYRLGILKVPA